MARDAWIRRDGSGTDYIGSEENIEEWPAERFERYLPPSPLGNEGDPVLGLFRVRIAQGDTPIQAYETVLRALIGER